MYAVEIRNLTKKFGDFVANDEISLSVEQGEIKAIVGENGAGKSTLMNMIYGLLKPTSGEILINGNIVNFSGPQDAIANGIGMVHQHFKLVPSLTVYENILLGAEELVRVTKQPSPASEGADGKPSKKAKKGFSFPLPFISKKKEIKLIDDVIQKFHFELKSTDRVQDISIGAKQRVEILKMLYRNVDILVLDEPTAVLTPQEVRELFVNLRELKAQGKTIIMITHKLGEVLEISDSVTVIKRGKVTGTVKTKETNENELARMMVGREVVLRVDKAGLEKNDDTEVVYEVQNLSTINRLGHKALNEVSFKIHKGEILGVAGVEGNGQTELVSVLTGLMTSTGGKVYLKGEDVTNAWSDQVRKSGIGVIPEDRYQTGLCADMSIADNLIAGYMCDKEICQHGILRTKNIKKRRDDLIKEFDIRIAQADGNVSQLSGGNAQKIIIAREFHSDPDVLIACQPTRGVDVGSIEFIHNSIIDLKRAGKSVLVVSSELTEVMGLSDRIVVMAKGKIVGEVDAATATPEEIGLLMAGISKNEGGDGHDVA